MPHPRIKSVVPWYGGKTAMIPLILDKIPPHDLYAEPFAGGAAVFFHKRPVRYQFLNDKNEELTNFYKIASRYPEELIKLIETTPHAESAYLRAKRIYKGETSADEMIRAWALWMCATGSVVGKLGGGFSWSKSNSGGSMATRFQSRIKALSQAIHKLQQVTILQKDALEVIKCLDRVGAFFFIDPPYPGADQGHYAGYNMEDFCHLLEALSSVEAKFMLTSYDYPELEDATIKNGWFTENHNLPLSAARGKNVKKTRKIEVITTNYPLSFPRTLFSKIS
ncbi:MAG: DNA adenine methylase [Bacteroidota bacterium]